MNSKFRGQRLDESINRKEFWLCAESADVMIRALTYGANTYELNVTVVDNLGGTSVRCIGDNGKKCPAYEDEKR